MQHRFTCDGAARPQCAQRRSSRTLSSILAARVDFFGGRNEPTHFMQPRVIPSEPALTPQPRPEAIAKPSAIASHILEFIERHHLFVQLIPFILVVAVLVLGAMNQGVADSLRFAGDLPDLR